MRFIVFLRLNREALGEMVISRRLRMLGQL